MSGKASFEDRDVRAAVRPIAARSRAPRKSEEVWPKRLTFAAQLVGFLAKGEFNHEDYRDSGSLGYRESIDGGKSAIAMKNIKRLVLGLVSSLLFTAGFLRAADRFDPINRELNSRSNENIVGAPDCTLPCHIVGAPDCTLPCHIVEDGK